MLKRLKQAWKTEPLTVAALVAVALGFLMWAAPEHLVGFGLDSERCYGRYESADNSMKTFISLLIVRITDGCGTLDFYWAFGWFEFDRLPAVLFFFTLSAFLFWRGTEQNIPRR